MYEKKKTKKCMFVIMKIKLIHGISQGEILMCSKLARIEYFDLAPLLLVPSDGFSFTIINDRNLNRFGQMGGLCWVVGGVEEPARRWADGSSGLSQTTQVFNKIIYSTSTKIPVADQLKYQSKDSQK